MEDAYKKLLYPIIGQR